MVIVAGSVWQPAYSAFTKTTATGSNTWTTGTVTFGANSPASAMFTVAGATPGSTGSQCIQLTYTGSLTASVRMYATVSGALSPYVTVQITEDSDTSHACGAFLTSGTLYNSTGMTDTTKTLSAFGTASTNYGSGVGAWSATNAATRLYTIRWQLQDDNAAVNKTASATFTWEAQS